MRKLILLASIFVIAMMFSSLSACTQPTPSVPATVPQETPKPPPVEPIVLKFAHDQPSKKGLSAGWEWWAEEVGKATEGRVKVEVYPGSTLFAMSAARDSLLSQVADMGNIALAVYEKNYPLSSVTNLPCLGFSDTREGTKAAAAGFMTLYEKFPEVQSEWKGFKLLWFHQLLNYVLVSKKKEIRIPADMKGLRVGCTGMIQQLVESAGGVPVHQVPPLSYENMDKGVVDASMLSWSAIESFRTWEIGNYYNQFSFGSSGQAVVANMDSWNKIPAGDQKIMLDLIPESNRISVDTTMEAVDTAKRKVADEGLTIIDLAPNEVTLWGKVAEPLWADWVNKKKEQGLNAQPLLDEWRRLVAEGRK